MNITGTHAIIEALKDAPKGSILYIQKGNKNLDELVNISKSSHGIIVKKVDRDTLDNMSIEHRGAVLSVVSSSMIFNKNKDVTLRSFLEGLTDEKGATVLLLDGITDPHNLGAIIRSCDQFETDLVVLPPSRSATINETVMRISSGAASYVKVADSENLNNAITLLKKYNFWIYASDMNGEPLNKVVFPKRRAFIMGREGEGVHRLLKENADHIVSIPTNGHIDSLNVSVATGIFLYASYIQK